MGFGCSYSLLEVDTIEFVKTPFYKKAIRTIIAVAISLFVNWIFDSVFFSVMSEKKQDAIEEYVGTRALPLLLISFFIYGPYVVIC